jgi:photosystem II stability/assembly factor-like uncharacterized protein
MTKSFARLLILILILFFSSNSNAQWVKGVFTDTTYYQGFGVNSFTICNGNIFALTNTNTGNQIYISSDNGNHWNSINFTLGNILYFFSTEKTLFNSVYDTTYRSTNNGRTWEVMNFSPISYLPYGPNYPDFTENANIKTYINNSTDIFLGTDIGGIFHSTNEGLTWINSSAGLPPSNYIVDPNAKTRIYTLIYYGSDLLANTDNGIYISTDNGKLWHAVVDSGYTGLPPSGPNNKVGIDALIANGSTLFASVSGSDTLGGIYRSDNNAITWTKTTDNNHNWDGISFTKKDSIIFANGFGLFRTKDNGATWQLINSNPSNCPLTVFNSNIFANFTSADISTDNGITWTPRNNGLGKYLNRYPVTVHSSGSIIKLDMYQGNDTFFSLDGGTSWLENFQLNTNNIGSYVNNDTNFVRIPLDYSSVTTYFLKDKSNKWFTIPGLNSGCCNSSLYTTDLIKADTFIIAASNKGVFRMGINNPKLLIYLTNISDWETIFTNYNSYSLSLSNNTVYLGTSNGVYQSTDFGASWNLCGLSNYSISQIFSIGSHLLANTNGGFFRSNDGGKTWNNINIGLENINTISLGGGNLFAVTYISSANGVSKGILWERPFIDVMTSINKEEKLPINYALSQNYPNPFNPSTVISYQIPKASHVLLKIYDVLGREVSTLVDKEQVPGNYKAEFKGQISSGVYFYRLTAGDFSQTKKMLMLK